MGFRNKNFKNRLFDKQGFTLVELMVASVLMIITFVGVLLAYIRCIELSEMSKNSSMAVNACKSKMEEIKNEVFVDIAANHDVVTFTTAGLNGIGVSYVDSSNPDLLKIKVEFCWRQKSGLVVGEDKDLDGVRDVGEDTDGDTMLSSPVDLTTYIYNE